MGMSLLSDYLKTIGATQEQFAKTMNVNQGTVARWCSDDPRTRKRPTIERAIRIEAATGGAVPVSSWAQDEAPAEDAA
jgi:transcriptional regulator with XRE-family HTH domain